MPIVPSGWRRQKERTAPNGERRGSSASAAIGDKAAVSVADIGRPLQAKRMRGSSHA